MKESKKEITRKEATLCLRELRVIRGYIEVYDSKQLIKELEAREKFWINTATNLYKEELENKG